MKKILLFLTLVILVGIGGWVLGYCLSTAKTPRGVRSPEAMLMWLKDEYELNPAQYATIQKLHNNYLPRAKELTRHSKQAYEALLAAVRENPADPAKISQSAQKFVEAKENFRSDFNRHIEAVAAAMSPVQSERFLEEAKNHLHE